jgi:hypothetical protein
MDDSFSILGLSKEICEEATERGKKLRVKHFVFDDLLDTSENLACYVLDFEENFSVYNYVLEKEKLSFFSRSEFKELGCYLGYKKGTLFTFEDFNFKIQSLDEFTLLVEAIEVSHGVSFLFELCNLCQLPERIQGELDVRLSLYSNSVKVLSSPSKIDQFADENREILKLAVKGNEKAKEKIERELGKTETEKLLKEFYTKPEQLFDTCILSENQNYTIIGIVMSVNPVTLGEAKLLSVDLYAEDMEFSVLLNSQENLKEGSRIQVHGKMYGVVA